MVVSTYLRKTQDNKELKQNLNHPMKATFEHMNTRRSAKRISMGMALTLVAVLAHPTATAAVSAVNLGSTSGFAVLAGSGITIAGAVNSTVITGDIGTFPTISITGLSNLALNGVNHAGDGVTQLAKNDLITAYSDAAGRSYDTNYADGFALVGTLTSGVYNGSGSLAISGSLTLDAQGDPNAVWIFQTATTLITASGSNIILTGGAQAGNVFWQVGSSATLGTGSEFTGSILAYTSITLDTGASVNGRVLARNGAVTMDYNTINVPEPCVTLLFGIGTVALFAGRRRLPVQALVPARIRMTRHVVSVFSSPQ